MAREHDFGELLERWRNRDRDAANELLGRWMGWLRRYAARRLGGELRALEQTGDIVQDTVMRLVNEPPPAAVTDDRELRRFLAQRVRYTLADRRDHHERLRRDARRSQPLPDDPSTASTAFASPDTSPTGAARRNETRTTIAALLEQMRTDDRELIEARLRGEGWSDVGARLGITAEAARMRTERAHERLARLYRRASDGTSPSGGLPREPRP